MMTTQRRRNTKSEECRACGVLCEAEQGWLYRERNTKRRYHLATRFTWFVKCESCHQGNKTRLTVLRDARVAKRAQEPVVRSWTAAQASKWSVTRITQEDHGGDVAIRVEGKGFIEIVSYRDSINDSFSAPVYESHRDSLFAGKPLSAKAAVILNKQVNEIVLAVQSEERQGAEAAVAKLTAAGVTATVCNAWHVYRLEYKGGSYTIWGLPGGKHRVEGYADKSKIAAGRWIETTVDALLAGD